MERGMKRWMLLWTVIVLTLQASPAFAPIAQAEPATPKPLVSADIMAKWNKVAWCEQHGNWHFNGSIYDGGLGMLRGNWYAYGGREFAPEAHLATPEEQVVVARRIQARAGYPEFVPDNNGGCSGW
jgi:Transglycosylase-like domain